jgi:hypothetical protein
MLSVDDAAKRIARAIAHGGRFHVIPWQMALAGRLLRVLPRPLYDVLFARAKRKPRAA